MPDPIKILLVDDVEENLLALEALLRRDGLELFAAQSGREALELVLAHDFALALLDVQMPEMDGFELAELMRGAARSRHVPIIFVTAEPSEQHRLFKGYESGAVDFLFKPIDAHVLRHKVTVFVDLYQQRQQLAAQVTEREQLIRQVRETLRLNEMFYAALGHDLRNPLGAIMTGATLLMRRSADEHTAAIASRILASGSRMTRMIEQLLDLARARLAGGIPVSPSPVNLKAVAEKVVAEYKATEPQRTIVLEASGDLHGTWDEARVAQVLSNLVANALQHGTPGGVVGVRLEGGSPREVVLAVTNAGTIGPAMMPHLFEPFRSGRNAERRSEGLGLGLYIVEQVVKAHHGAVHVQSSEAEGTTFDVRLPRAVSPTPASVA